MAIVAAVATELLENAVKYAARSEDRIRLRISSYQGTICVESRNTAKRSAVDSLRKIFDTLATDDPSDMLQRQLEHTAAVQPTHSGVGLMKLRAESNVGLGALIEAMDAEHAVVRLRAVLCTRGARK